MLPDFPRKSYCSIMLFLEFKFHEAETVISFKNADAFDCKSWHSGVQWGFFVIINSVIIL